MTSNTFTAAVKLYKAGTLTLEQAASRAGVPKDKMESHLEKYGATIREGALEEQESERVSIQ